MDPISDMLTRIRNAIAAKKPEVIIPLSRLKLEIAKILQTENFVSDLRSAEKERQLRIFLKYGKDGLPAIHNLKRISKPGRRVYAAKDRLPKSLGGLGIVIISTPRGLMTDKAARKIGLGGEVICEVY